MQKISKLSHRSIYDSDIEYFSNGAYAIEKLFEDLKNAKKFIHLQFYIVKPGEVFEELKSILLKKVKEGIKIRMLIDDFGR
jgi:cardiolipin synthase